MGDRYSPINYLIEACIKNSITLDEYLCILYLYLNENNYNSYLIGNYLDKVKEEKVKKGLVKKGIIFKDGNDYRISYHYKENFFIDFMVAGQELWDSFPLERSYRIDGRILIAKKFNNFHDLSDLFYYYGNQIYFASELHRRVLNALEVAKRYKAIDFTIEEWVKNRIWEGFFELIAREEKKKNDLI